MILNKLIDANSTFILDLAGGSFYICDESNPFSEQTKNVVEKTNDNGTTLKFNLNQVDFDSMWNIHTSKNEANLEQKINQEIEKLTTGNISEEEKIFGAEYSLDPRFVSALRMTLFEIVPHFLENKEKQKTEIDNLIEGKTADPDKNEIYEFWEKKLDIKKDESTKIKIDLEKLKKAEIKVPELETFSEYMIRALKRMEADWGSPHIIFIDRKYHWLEKVEYYPLSNKTRININNAKYILGRNINFDQYYYFDEEFNKYAAKYASREANKRVAEINKEKTIDITKYEREFRIISEITKRGLNNIEFDNFGLKLNKATNNELGGQIELYLKVQKYAIKDVISGYGRYYVFDPCNVTIAIFGDKRYSAPYLMGKAISPFIRYGYNTNYQICMGSYDTRKLEHMPLPEKIAKHLQDAKSVIISGYTKLARPHIYIHEGYIENINDPHRRTSFKEITKEEAERQKIPITNVDADML